METHSRVLKYLQNNSKREVTKKIGERVKSLRLHRGLRQKDLSELSGVAQSTISKLESGDIEEIGSLQLTRLGCALGEMGTSWWMKHE